MMQLEKDTRINPHPPQKRKELDAETGTSVWCGLLHFMSLTTEPQWEMPLILCNYELPEQSEAEHLFCKIVLFSFFLKEVTMM